MKTPNYIIKGTDEYYDLCTIIDITELKNRLILYAYELGYAFSYPDRPLRLTNKRNDNDYKRADIFTKFINILGLDIIGFSYTKQYYIMKMIMDELIEEGKMFKRKLYKIYTGNCEGGYIYSYHNKKGGELNSIWWQYADTWDKLETRKEKLSKIADSYHEEKFISDTICPNPESLVGKEVIIDKNGIEENYTYRVRVRDGVRECRKIDSMNWEKIENIIDLDKSKELKEEVTNMEDMKELEKKPIKEYAIFDNMLNTIALLNMKGFEKFQILTVEGGYFNDGNLSDRDFLNNKVKIGDKILGMDFVITVLG